MRLSTRHFRGKAFCTRSTSHKHAYFNQISWRPPVVQSQPKPPPLINLPQRDPHTNLDLLGDRGNWHCVHLCSQLPYTLAHRSTSRHTARRRGGICHTVQVPERPALPLRGGFGLTDVLVQVTDPGGEHGRLERKAGKAFQWHLVSSYREEHSSRLR